MSPSRKEHRAAGREDPAGARLLAEDRDPDQEGADRADAAGLVEAARSPQIREVPVKTPRQQGLRVFQRAALQLRVRVRLCEVPRHDAGAERRVAGVADRTLVINLPGSSGGVKDALAVLAPVIAHALDQIRGGDHPR